MLGNHYKTSNYAQSTLLGRVMILAEGSPTSSSCVVVRVPIFLYAISAIYHVGCKEPPVLEPLQGHVRSIRSVATRDTG